ncbi:VC0807 family protein [Lentzea sp. NPDC060358]|uniref:VC0807 family protein n=1 Tax=Lentzea sp. NPDC060358 TaxID=3347103 RepID=UPI003664A309
MTGSWWRVLAGVAENIGIPVGSYLLLTWLGWQPVWALVGAAGVSVVVLGVQYVRTRELTTLGVLVLVRFALGVAVAAVTGDARLELAKDFAITSAVGVFAVVSLAFRRPLIARIRRDLSGEPGLFDHRWDHDRGFRVLHRRLTVGWSAGLLCEGVVAVVLIYALPLTAAVVATSVLAPATLLGLIGVTEWLARRHVMQNELAAPHAPGAVTDRAADR